MEINVNSEEHFTIDMEHWNYGWLSPNICFTQKLQCEYPYK